MNAAEISDELLAKQLWALGDVVRLRLLRLLPDSCDCECSGANNVSQLAAKLGLSQPTVSHHLRVLRQMGLVQSTRMCRDVYYWLCPDATKQTLGALETFLATRHHLDTGEEGC